jgi:hypothetical protein
MDEIDDKEFIGCTAEVVNNGGPIDWAYWNSLRNITPEQGARLACRIDPIKWPGNEFAQGAITKHLRDKLERLTQLLASQSNTWTLFDIDDFLRKSLPAFDVMSNLVSIEENHLEQYEGDLDYEERKKQLFEQELNASIKAGRYTLEQAAVYFERNSRTDMSSILEALMNSAREGELKTYAPGSDGPYRSRTVREFYEEVFWDDLNEWRKSKWPRLGCSFPEPENSETAKPKPETATNGADRERTNQLHILIWRVYRHLQSNGGRSTAQQVWNEIQFRRTLHDKETIIQEIDAISIAWCSGYGNEQTLKRSSFDKTLSNLKRNPPF